MIAQAMIVGDGQGYLTALLVNDPERLCARACQPAQIVVPAGTDELAHAGG